MAEASVVDPELFVLSPGLSKSSGSDSKYVLFLYENAFKRLFMAFGILLLKEYPIY
jgi:hypothetical protein